MERRDFLKKSGGIVAVIGLAASLLSMESCSKSGDTYSVNTSKCNGDEKCVSVCHVSAISIQSGKAYINSGKCTGCGQCASVCPQNAIS